MREFEWDEFNQRFKVTSPSPCFASDVINQRQMEYLMSWNPDGFSITDGCIRLKGKRTWTPQEIEETLVCLIGFFAQIPDFVWHELGS